MRSIAVKTMLAAVIGGCLTAPVQAGVKVVTCTQTYPIVGGTGQALVDAMDRNGPRQGFMTRAIAQTTYTVDWRFEVRSTGKACRLTAADGTLNLTYVFPRVTSPMPASLAARWKRFFAGVRKHEHTHGRIARTMVAAASKAARGVAYDDDPSCRRTRREAKRRIDAVYRTYEARQVAFDKREHGDDGPVERLVSAFVRGR